MLKSLIQKPLPVELLDYGNPLIKGLVVCWLINEGSGDKVYDVTGNNKTGTIIGGGWVPGTTGHAIDLVAGNNDEITYNSSGVNIIPGGWKPFTLICITEPAARNTTNYALFGIGDDSFASAKNCGVIQSSTTDYRYCMTVMGNVGTYFTWGKGGLTHFALVYESSTSRKLYVNSQLMDTDTDEIALTNTPDILSIGNVGGSGDYHTSQKAEALLLFDKPLSASEIQQLYENPFCIFNPEIKKLWQVTVVVGGVVNVAGQADITTSSLAGFRRNRPGAAQADIDTLSYAGILREHVAAAQADIVTSSFAGFRRERVAAGQSDIVTSSTAGLWRNRPIAGDIVIGTSSTAGLWRDRPMAGESAVLISTTAGMRQSLGCTANIVTSSLAGFRRNRVAACESSILTQSYAGMRRLDIPGAGTANIVTATYAGMTGGLAVSLEEIFRNRRFRDSGVFARRRMKGAF